MLGLKLNHVSKSGPWSIATKQIFAHFYDSAAAVKLCRKFSKIQFMRLLKYESKMKLPSNLNWERFTGNFQSFICLTIPPRRRMYQMVNLVSMGLN